MAQPNFPFPLPSLINTNNLKNIPIAALPKFYGLATKDPDTSSLNLTYSIIVLTTTLMPISSNYFQQH